MLAREHRHKAAAAEKVATMSIEWLWASLLVGAMVLFAVAGTLLVRRLVSAEVLKLNNEVAGFIYAVIGVVYAVLLGFTAIIVWEQYDRVEVVVEREANELADLYRDSQTFPDDVRREVETHLHDYARLVVEKEWPAMAEGKSSPEAYEVYNQLWRTYHRFQPQNESEKIWYEQSLTRLNELGDQRRLRLLSSRAEGVPGLMWVVLLGAGVITIGFSFFFGTRNTTAQVLMAAGLAMTIALVLLAILAMQHPFAGIDRVEPEAFNQFTDNLDVRSQTGIGQAR
jgi:hypothetical protein